MRRVLGFIGRILQIGAGYALAIPMFLFIQTTGLFWRIVYGLEAEKQEREQDRQREVSETGQGVTGGEG